MHSERPFSLGYKSTRSPLILTNSRNLVRTKKEYPYLRPACTLDMSPGPGHVTQSYLRKNKTNVAPPFRPWGPITQESRTSNPWCTPPMPHPGSRFTTRGSALSGRKNGHHIRLEICMLSAGLKRRHPRHLSQISTSGPNLIPKLHPSFGYGR